MDVDADPEDLRAMAATLRVFSHDMDDNGRTLTALFSSIEWDDEQYQRFREHMQPVLQMLGNVASSSSEIVSYVEEKADILDEYLRH